MSGLTAWRRSTRKNAARLAVFSGMAFALSGCLTMAGIERNPAYSLRNGILAGDFGNGLSDANRAKAIQAEVKAVSDNRPGLSLEWQGRDGVSGKVTPEQVFEIGSRPCRRYLHELRVDGGQRRRAGTACRDENGNWQPVS
jgi:surface antigen